MKIHIKSVFVRVAFDSMLLSIICKMLYQINQNNVFRMFGYGLQMLVLACCVVQELITFKRKSFDFTVAILLLLISFESLVAISTHSVYMPYAPVDILIWPISVIVYYNYSYYYDITKIAQNKAIWFFFAMCAIAVPLIKIHLSGAGNIGQVIFLTYFCITTLPLVLILTNNRSYRNLSMVLAVLISTASTKRAGTLALILGLFIMLVVEAHIQGTLNQRWKKYLKIMLLILIGTIMVFYLESTGRIQILDRFARLGDDGGSGRDVIWLIVLNAYHSSGLVQRLFGHGFQSVYYILRPGGFYRFAHNSYIEYLYDYGTVGLILLLVFIIALIVSTIDMVRRKARFAPVMCLLLVISVFLGMFSYFFEESNIIMPVAVAYGVILGMDKKEKNIKDEI
ncbi:O-antigen ligase family protein [Faecalibacterium prausnitzii]|uniref:O-antigen ligase family protein n=1 Tax=Faecalibacterium prausnitzii TaxID=853 RepID=UPI002914C075|nr:O-antigen ligase family protein [Faecalibacterium prausnitzii]MDU8724171.1 O-antigen ligase family protein [Faecalibacterium prausnitzii]